jgi:hypothetical protein
MNSSVDQGIASSPRRTKPRWVIVALAFAALVALTELGVRVAGLVDFPTYLRDDYFGYVPRPGQSGRFLTTNAWSFNDRSMGVAEPWRPKPDRTDILLIGNSIVLGGNPYDQKNKLGPLIQSRLNATCSVWPVAAGGWSTVNEFRFLERRPDVAAGSDFFIWEVMAHQMGGAASWQRETMHPTEHPSWATAYVVRKALGERFPSAARFVLRAPEDAAPQYMQFEQTIARLVGNGQRRPAGLIFLYPDQRQLAAARRGEAWLPERDEVTRIAKAHGLAVVDLAEDPRWTETMYRDGVHPTREGNITLSSILEEAVRRYQIGC